MLYLKLFHGRNDPAEDMDDWGFDGPVFGPYQSIHTTYTYHLKMNRTNGGMDELRIVEDVIFYDNKYYGDWSVYETPEESLIEKYDASKAQPPKTERHQAKIVVYIKGGICQDVKTNIPENCWEYMIVDYDNEPDLPEDVLRPPVRRQHKAYRQGARADIRELAKSPRRATDRNFLRIQDLLNCQSTDALRPAAARTPSTRASGPQCATRRPLLSAPPRMPAASCRHTAGASVACSWRRRASC